MKLPIDKLQSIRTPFYYYDMELLDKTLKKIKEEADKYNFIVHYAIKANANDHILLKIKDYGFGIDCVSGYELKKAVDKGFASEGIVFAGVGKADWEIEVGIDNDIACFNIESTEELKVINEIATSKNKVVNIAIRINPNIEANTHHYITTGLDENKFGIPQSELDSTVNIIKKLKSINLQGIHFHIGSQIMDLNSYKNLCLRINEIQNWFVSKNIELKVINVGGGLGIDYEKPQENPISDFTGYFETFHKHLKLKPGQKVHFELGRSVVGQCGNLITKVLYLKKGINTNFVIVDGGMTDLIRPALYQAFHKIENLSSTKPPYKYDVVGPICESSDSFGKDIELPETTRGDILAIRSAGAYGEVMVSNYNLREAPLAYYSDLL